MVLHSLLEDFLQRTGTTRHVDQTAVGFGKDGVFANAVVEELGNMGGKDGRRFVAIVPGGDGQALVLALRVLADDFECR